MIRFWTDAAGYLQPPSWLLFVAIVATNVATLVVVRNYYKREKQCS